MKATAKLDHGRDSEFFAFMHGSHETLERLAARLVAALAADDRIEIQTLWPEIERKLLAHLEAEERFVLPAFARTDEKEAIELIRQHGKFRELLLELGVAVDLHYARLPRFQLFLAMLREHAQREEALMYRWASERLDARLAAAAKNHR
jgi:hemerythrin superfamily protein